MHTAILTFALVTLAPGAVWESESNYGRAKEQAAAQKKPLLIVFSPGAKSWTKIAKESPSPEINKILAEKYVCLFVDTATSSGKKFAADYELSGDLGLIISDRALKSQAFWHQGDMSNSNLVHYLTKYADAGVEVRTTETVYTSRMSFYPSYQGATPVTRTVNC